MHGQVMLQLLMDAKLLLLPIQQLLLLMELPPNKQKFNHLLKYC